MERSSGSEGPRGFGGLQELLADAIDGVAAETRDSTPRKSPATAVPGPGGKTLSASPVGQPSPRPAASKVKANDRSRIGVRPTRQRQLPWGWIAVGAGLLFAALFDRVSLEKPSGSDPGAQVRPPIPITPKMPKPTTPRPMIEQMPPIGTDLVLSEAQIRYCMFEEIRIDATRAQIDTASEVQVERFNESVDDFNSRCSSFRYRAGELESVKAEAERERRRLEGDGRNRALSWRATRLLR